MTKSLTHYKPWKEMSNPIGWTPLDYVLIDPKKGIIELYHNDGLTDRPKPVRIQREELDKRTKEGELVSIARPVKVQSMQKAVLVNKDREVYLADSIDPFVDRAKVKLN